MDRRDHRRNDTAKRILPSVEIGFKASFWWNCMRRQLRTGKVAVPHNDTLIETAALLAKTASRVPIGTYLTR